MYGKHRSGWLLMVFNVVRKRVALAGSAGRLVLFRCCVTERVLLSGAGSRRDVAVYLTMVILTWHKMSVFVVSY